MGEIEKQVGNYLKGEYVKEKGIAFLTIATEAEDVDGNFGKKLECEVKYDGQTADSPTTWTMNKKSRNALIDKLGKNTAKWVGFKVPIETAITEKGRAIYVDIEALNKMEVVA